mmetsp:Transcript_6886/g.17807  ORF Transcript_6886/g.17807 Transcript_6886/m.17807 type:complete len:278 (-) Transcript_6886:589-1422(-)
MAAPIPYLTGRVPAATFRDAAVFAPRQTRTPPLRPPHLRSTTHLRSRTCPPHAPARGRWAARPAENAQRGFALAASPHVSGVEIDTTGPSSFSVESDVNTGKVMTQLLAEEDEGAARVVLTRAFAGTPDGRNLSDIREYMTQVRAQFPDAVILAARYIPSDPASGQSRVVGLACLSFTPSTRDQFNTLQPGDECCYLSNMAVDQKMRRQGVATALLSACDKYVRENTEMRRIQLHVRLDATAAKALYAKWGYKTQAEDGFMVRLRGDSQRALMCKDL